MERQTHQSKNQVLINNVGIFPYHSYIVLNAVVSSKAFIIMIQMFNLLTEYVKDQAKSLKFGRFF